MVYIGFIPKILEHFNVKKKYGNYIKIWLITMQKIHILYSCLHANIKHPLSRINYFIEILNSQQFQQIFFNVIKSYLELK